MSKKETEPFIRTAVAPMIRAAGRRVADEDEFELRALLDLQRVLDEAITTAVRGQRRRRTWEWLAEVTGLASRQAAFQRWGQRRDDAA